MTEFSGSKGFLYIPVSIAHDKELLKRPKAILLMGEIVSMLNVTGKFFMSNNHIAKKLNCDVRTIQRYAEYLEKKQFIKRSLVFTDDTHKEIKGRLISAGPALSSAFCQGWGDTDVQSRSGDRGGHGTETVRVTAPTPYKENRVREQSKRAEDILSGKPDDVPDKENIKLAKVSRKVVDYLNDQVGTHYKPSSRATKDLIKARINDGWQVDDFKQVIDNKAHDWKSDKRMAKFLRPVTLFGTKFEDYLNEAATTNGEEKNGGFEDTMMGKMIDDEPEEFKNTDGS